ncbi:MAG: HlyD family type I secretion periplasmic adaptor subunit, partial [Rhizobiales bacterium]|nr:HlyD family type I secretion periplasmic adaptor subunit [Hyphomicrobiales bacterium]
MAVLKDDEFEFANDIKAALVERPPRLAWALILAVLLTLAAAAAWASWAVVEETTTGAGRVIPTRQLQVVQSLEAGLVREILHQEGDLVEAGEILMHIDDTGVSSRLGELKQRQYAFLAQIARLEAEAREAEAVKTDAELEREARGAVDAERAVFKARREQLSREITVLGQQALQREQEVKELRVREQKLVSALAPLERELELTRELRERGVIPEIEMLRLERQVAENRGELEVVRAAMPRAATAVEEARGMSASRRANYRAGAREQLAKTRSELAVIEETLRAARDQVVRTTLRAPVRGIVNKMNLNTIGAVVQPGQSIIEIVPIDDALLIEARVRPQDVAFIRPEQAASVKLSAYDYRIYGALAGEVERISADTIADSEGDTFYRVIVRTNQNHILEGGQRLPIIPGMVATVDIQTGEKTVLD